jgi:enterochelin esterase family protein
MIFLDGELYRDRVQAVEIIEALRARQAIAEAWYVFVSYFEPDARWIECPCHPPFARFIVQELLPWLERTEPGIAAAPYRVLAGVSYTGLAAAFAVREFPGTFQKVICQSGSFWSEDGKLADEIRHAGLHLGADFYLDVGTRETQTNVKHRENLVQVMSQIEGVHRVRDALRATGHTVHYAEFDGAHEFSGWRQTLPGALEWALPTP